MGFVRKGTGQKDGRFQIDFKKFLLEFHRARLSANPSCSTPSSLRWSAGLWATDRGGMRKWTAVVVCVVSDCLRSGRGSDISIPIVDN